MHAFAGHDVLWSTGDSQEVTSCRWHAAGQGQQILEDFKKVNWASLFAW
jgi:hypothetical protein